MTVKHITHYKLLSDTDAETLSERVETAIHAGWQPFGPPSASAEDGKPVFAQAIVKYADRFG